MAIFLEPNHGWPIKEMTINHITFLPQQFNPLYFGLNGKLWLFKFCQWNFLEKASGIPKKMQNRFWDFLTYPALVLGIWVSVQNYITKTWMTFSCGYHFLIWMQYQMKKLLFILTQFFFLFKFLLSYFQWQIHLILD